jgi:hypothetical protein
MAQTSETSKQTLPRGFKILFGLSLAVNLAVVGLIAGAALRKGAHGMARAGGPSAYARPYIQALPHDDRRAIFEAVRSDKNGAGRGGRRAHYQQVLTELRAEVFVRSQIEAALKQQTEKALSGQNGVQTQWLNRIEKMNLQERRDYADAVEDVLKRGPKRKGKPVN